jgi:hypothetical protein
MVVDDRTRLIAGSGFLTFLFLLKTISYNIPPGALAALTACCANRREIVRKRPAVA